MSGNKFFTDDSHQVLDGNIVYASDLNSPLAALAIGIDSLTDNIQNDGTVTGDDTGTANAYVVDIDPAPTSYVEGQSVWLKPVNSCTGPSTINVNSLGVKEIRRNGLQELRANDLVANYYTHLKYNGTYFLVVSASGRGEVSADAAEDAAAAAAASAAAAAADAAAAAQSIANSKTVVGVAPIDVSNDASTITIKIDPDGAAPGLPLVVNDAGTGVEFGSALWRPTTGGEASHNATDAVNDLDFTALNCRDSTNSIDIVTAALTREIDGNLGTGNGGLMDSSTKQANHIYMFVAMGDGTNSDIGFIDSTDLANIATRVATAGYTKYLIIGMNNLNAAGEWAGQSQNGPYFQRHKASESVLASGLALSYGTVDHTTLLVEDYVELIEYGVGGGFSLNYYITASDDGTNVSFLVGSGDGPATPDTNLSVWGDYVQQKSGIVPFKADREFLPSISTNSLLLKAYKFKGSGRV